MIDRKALLDGCKRLMSTLEEDLISRSHGDTALSEAVETLTEEFRKAKDAKRTAQNFEDWRTDYATQQAAAWVLSAVFVRFLEDNELIDPPQLAGPGERLKRARDQHELYFRSHPTETDREYLLLVFTEVGKLPGGREIFGKYNSVFEMPNWLSGDAAGEILKFLQKIDADTGELVHDFTDPVWDTRFLGDLYQDLSEAARKKYALLQTPEFVEEFILDRTLDPALEEFGLDAPAVVDNNGDPITEPGFRMIDPACGSGHFLLGAFRRILDRWQRKEPGTSVRELVQHTLNSVNGVDINPYATAIARFRLLVAALQASEITKLKDAPAFHFNLAAGDSLLHGAPGAEQQLLSIDPLAHHYQVEDIGVLRHILRAGTFHAAVANPPYITVKDKLLNQAYRNRYGACHRQYSLAVPFMERIFNMTIRDGFAGQITANSFMKREFGKKLIEDFFPTIDLTHVIDTSGAYIPGHGTPTVILFGRQRSPLSETLRTVMGIRGEPNTPQDPATGLVWTSITNQIDHPGSESDFVSVDDSHRILFHSHPWSVGGGGASELKASLEASGTALLGDTIEAIGRTTVVGDDDAWVVEERSTSRRYGIEQYSVPFCVGEVVRDWTTNDLPITIYPYSPLGGEVVRDCEMEFWVRLWPMRRLLQGRSVFGKSLKDMARPWWEHLEHYRDKLRTPLFITYAAVATHNHFVLDRGGKVFKQSAPVIKLPVEATEDDYANLLGPLNSSTACFWMKQVFHCKGSTVDQRGARQTTVPFEDFYDMDATKLKQFPLPSKRPLSLAQRLDQYALSAQEWSPASVLARWTKSPTDSLSENLLHAEHCSGVIRRQMISLQEELDWECYLFYDVIEEDLTYPRSEEALEVDFGQRAFEIVLARKMATGETTTTWFKRHGSTPTSELPATWPDDYRELIERRIAHIETCKAVRLIERPEYKRRWNSEPWENQRGKALRTWLLGRLESYFDFDGRLNESGQPTAKLDVALCSVAALADIAQQESQFQEAGALYTGDSAFAVMELVSQLVEEESVPHLPILRYKAPGLRKRDEWEKTWALQRQEDAIDARTELPKDDPNYLSKDQAERMKKQELGDIPVPPKYASADFISTGGARYWRLRGKLDVPKERWVSFPHCEGQDGTLMIAWAGYDHLQLARCISAHYVDVQERIGGRDDPRLVPLLASLIELLPWLKQWHNEVDPEFNMAMGDYFEGFIQEEARGLGKTLEEIRAWEPPKKTKTKKTKRKKKAAAVIHD